MNNNANYKIHVLDLILFPIRKLSQLFALDLVGILGVWETWVNLGIVLFRLGIRS